MEFTEEEGNLPNGRERALLPQGCSSTQHPKWTAARQVRLFFLTKISVTSAASLSGAFALAIWDKSGFLMPCMRLM